MTGPGLGCPGLAAAPVLEASGVCSLSTAPSPAAGGGARGVACRVWAGRAEVTRYGALGPGLIPGQIIVSRDKTHERDCINRETLETLLSIKE